MALIVQVDLHRIGRGAVVEGVTTAKRSVANEAIRGVVAHAVVITAINGVVTQAAHKGVAAEFVAVIAHHVIAITTVQQIVANATHEGVIAVARDQGVVTGFKIEGAVIAVIIGPLINIGTHIVIAGAAN